MTKPDLGAYRGSERVACPGPLTHDGALRGECRACGGCDAFRRLSLELSRPDNAFRPSLRVSMNEAALQAAG